MCTVEGAVRARPGQYAQSQDLFMLSIDACGASMTVQIAVAVKHGDASPGRGFAALHVLLPVPVWRLCRAMSCC